MVDDAEVRFRGMARRPMGSENPLRSETVGGWTPSACRRPGYPLMGCSPAEPISVSPGLTDIAGLRLVSKGKVQLGFMCAVSRS